MKPATRTRAKEPTITAQTVGVAQDANRSVRRASTVAGVGLVLMSALAAFGYLVVIKGLIVPGNAALTAKKVADHQGMLRFGIVSLNLVAALDVVVAWALYRVFKPVSAALSRLAAWLRLAYVGVFAVAISRLVGGLESPAQALGHINTFGKIWDAGLVLFGLHLFVLAYLAYRSGYVPKLFAVLLCFAGFGYVFDSSVRAFTGFSPGLSAITGIGEFVFALWLVIRGRQITLRSHDGAIGAAR